ncbi:hypothetical protein LCGC14_2780870, partial [marine sediment metagenome]
SKVVGSSFGEDIGAICFDGLGTVLGAVVDLYDYFVYEAEGFKDGFSVVEGE